MCFSANVSFTVGSGLIALGLYTVASVYRSHRNYLLFALIPILFGLQQCVEGLVWISLHANDAFYLQLFSYAYLFFAFFLWPTCMPLSIYLIELDPSRKNVMRVCVILGWILAFLLYVPLLVGVVPVSVAQVHHSLNYTNYQSVYFLWAFGILYSVIVLLPMLCASDRNLVILGGLSVLALLISYGWLLYAFTSIWCFAEAFISLGVAYIIYQRHAA